MPQNRIFKVGGNSKYTPLGVKKEGCYTMSLPMQESIWERDIRNDLRGSDEDQEFLNKVDDAKAESENKRLKEEKEVLDEYRKKKQKLWEECEEERLKGKIHLKNHNEGKALEISEKKQTKLLLQGQKNRYVLILDR